MHSYRVLHSFLVARIAIRGYEIGEHSIEIRLPVTFVCEETSAPALCLHY